jgi:hypothetical protein
MIMPHENFIRALLYVVGLQLVLACAAQAADGPHTPITPAIRWDKIGANAGVDYHGEGLAVMPGRDGARLRCVFQQLDGEATGEGLWLVPP